MPFRSPWLPLLLTVLIGCADSTPAPARQADPPPAAEDAAPPATAPMLVTGSTRAVFERAAAFARTERLHERPMGEIVQAIGAWFAGTPYVEGLLDKPETETLVVSLDGFDCVLFVEATLALARGAAVEDYTFDGFARRIEEQRYREGRLDGYCSRLHYFTDWIADNARRGLVRDVTAEIGGASRTLDLTFMGEHRASYPRLVDDDRNYRCILDMEAGLAGLRQDYVPQDRIREAADRLQPGDVIATTTGIPGLDVTHTGFVYVFPDGRRGFLHASSTGEVKIAPDLQAYVEGVRVQTGIVVARPAEVRRP